MGRFAGMREARPTAGGLYFSPGNYLVRVNACKVQESSKTQGKEFFIVETEILEADEESGLKVGQQPAWVVNLTGDYPTLAISNIKGFLLAAFTSWANVTGGDPPNEDEIGEEDAEEVTGEDNPLAGVILRVSAFNKGTQKGGTFTRVNWSAPEREVSAQYIAA